MLAEAEVEDRWGICPGSLSIQEMLAEPQVAPGSCPFNYTLQGAGGGGEELSPPYRFILGVSKE